MALRPGRCYKKIQRPYTRQSQRKPRKSYIKGVPRAKITEFELGKKGKYDKTLFLVSQEDVQIRHNALEAVRISVVQGLEKKLGKNVNFFLKIRVFPHHVLRENALATGAGADRYQQGMRQSFGKPISTAAQIRKNQKILEIRINTPSLNIAKNALKKAMPKMPTPCKILIQD